MSGLLALVHFDGPPVDGDLLRSLTETMARQGPDRRNSVSVGAVGLGSALLRTTDDACQEQQPFTLDEREWIVADARIDAREDLVRALDPGGRLALDRRPDVELILHAYRAWGEQCVDHLIGDFAFAIWDTRARRLFAARDHFGVKPLFYAWREGRLIVSNALDTIRQHPSVSNTLNEIAIADYLVRGGNQDPTTTAFVDVMRAPAAHVLTTTGQAPVIRRYWTTPRDRAVRYRRAADYVEHFRDVLGRAAADRVRSPRISIFMSGGLDSTSVALSVSRNQQPRVRGCDLQSFTQVLDSLMPDEERHYASVAATALGIRGHVLASDTYAPFAHFDNPFYRTPEPAFQPFAEAEYELNTLAAQHARVALTGIGGDPLFLYRTDIAGLIKRGRVDRIAADVLTALLLHRQLPPVTLRTSLRELIRPEISTVRIPGWLDPEFVHRLRLEERYQGLSAEAQWPRHSTRHEAQTLLLNPKWARLFESNDPAVVKVPIEERHPFFDLRVIEYLWSIPAIPWIPDKFMLRSAMEGSLPLAISHRPKTPLRMSPLLAWSRKPETAKRLQGLVSTPLGECCRLAFPLRFDGSTDIWTTFRPLGLEYWLRASGLSLS